MRISAVAAMWLCLVFALVCFGVAYNGFSALQTLTGVEERELSLGYAWFWTFLGVVASAFGVLSWMIKQGKFGDIE
jgi:H+/Cl- antiporter ClcA